MNVCPECNKKTDFHVISKVETYPVKGKNITITANVKVCDACGEEIYDSELDSDNLSRAYLKAGLAVKDF